MKFEHLLKPSNYTKHAVEDTNKAIKDFEDICTANLDETETMDPPEYDMILKENQIMFCSQ